MKLLKSSLPLLLLVSVSCFAQSEDTGDITDVSKVTFLNPGLSYEKRIGKLQSLYGQVFLNTSASYSYSSSMGSTGSVYFDPAATLQYRYYFNARRREEKGKRIEMNSMNYVGPVYEFVSSKAAINSDYFNEAKRRAINKFGVIWGMQRNYPKRFSLDLNLGLGYLFTKGTYPDNFGNIVRKNIDQVTFMGQINLGFWLNKRK